MLTIEFWALLVFMTVVASAFVALPLMCHRDYQLSLSIKVLLIVLPVMTVGSYLLWGNSHQLQQFWRWQSQEAEVKKRVAEVKDPQQLIEQLQGHLQLQPDSSEGWFLLGKLYLGQQQYSLAEQSLQKAYHLNPKNHDYLLVLAKADFFNHQGHLDSGLEVILKGVLNSLSQPVDALNLLAVNAYKNKDYHLAVKYWQQALALTPADSPDSRTLLDMISQAQRQE